MKTSSERPSGMWRTGIASWFFLLVLSLPACSTVPPLPPLNLQEPGWTVRQGQAVWRMKRGGRELSGELMLATRPDGRVFVQFSKMPFPLLVAQATPNTWEVEIPVQKKRYSGHGRPPTRLIWLYLPRVFSGQPPPKGWSWQRLDNETWRLENRATGESVEGYLSQ